MKLKKRLLSFQGNSMQVPPFFQHLNIKVSPYTNMPDVENILEKIPEK